MPRHDGSLYTGLSSQSFAKQQEQKKERLDERRTKRERLLPAGEIVQEQINLEVKQLRDLKTLDVQLSAEDLKAEVRGRALAIEHLTHVQVRLGNLLREMKEPVQKKAKAALTFGDDESEA